MSNPKKNNQEVHALPLTGKLGEFREALEEEIKSAKIKIPPTKYAAQDTPNPRRHGLGGHIIGNAKV